MADLENESHLVGPKQQSQQTTQQVPVVQGLQPVSKRVRAEEMLMTAQGKTTISEDVVSKVAGIAAGEIDGVHELVASTGAGRALSGLARAAGGDTRSTGVHVEVGEHEAAVDLSVIVDYGVSIPQVAEAVRHNITSNVWKMTGLRVKEINIGVIDLYFPQIEQSFQPQL